MEWLQGEEENGTGPKKKLTKKDRAKLFTSRESLSALMIRNVSNESDGLESGLAITCSVRTTEESPGRIATPKFSDTRCTACSRVMMSCVHFGEIPSVRAVSIIAAWTLG
jgi:hypothetical protein